MANIKSHKRIKFYIFLLVGFLALLLINFLPLSESSATYSGPTNICLFDCEGVDQGPFIHRVNASTSHGFPFGALFTKHTTMINGVETYSSYKVVDRHNLEADIIFVIVSDLVIASAVYLIYLVIYKKRKSAVK